MWFFTGKEKKKKRVEVNQGYELEDTGESKDIGLIYYVALIKKGEKKPCLKNKTWCKGPIINKNMKLGMSAPLPMHHNASVLHYTLQNVGHGIRFSLVNKNAFLNGVQLTQYSMKCCFIYK